MPYMVFNGDHITTSGGMDDFRGSFRSITVAIREAKKFGEYSPESWAQVVDTDSLMVVFEAKKDGASKLNERISGMIYDE